VGGGENFRCENEECATAEKKKKRNGALNGNGT
jgi:hypothetical protein